MKWIKMATVAAFAGVLLGCSPSRPTLHVYNWADYIKPDLIKQFEREFDCRVVIDTFDSNEAMYARMKAGATGYDLIFPSSYMVQVMHDQGMIQELDHALIPNLQHIDSTYLSMAMDPECHHSVPYMISTAGIAYRSDRMDELDATWAVFDREDLRGRMTMLNDMRETVGAALKFLGYSLNTTDENELAEARDVVIRWKKNLAKFENEQYKNGLASGEFLLVHGYNGDIMQVIEENEDIIYVIPEEGVSIALDEMVIPVGARQVDLAHAFINFLHEPEIAAENTEYVYFLCPNAAAYELMDEELLEDPALALPPELLAKSEVIRDLGEDNAKYIRIWDQIKAAE